MDVEHFKLHNDYCANKCKRYLTFFFLQEIFKLKIDFEKVYLYQKKFFFFFF